MNELINVQIETKEGMNVVSSRVIAKELGKQHFNVVRDIEKIAGVSSQMKTPEIIENKFQNEQNKQWYKEYLLTKDGFTLYMFNIQGYQNFKIAYINKFNEMEKQLKEQKPQLPNDYLSALKALVESEEEKQKLLQETKVQAIQIEEQKPKVQAYEEFMDCDGLYTVTNVSKILELRPKKEVFPFLRSKGLVLKNGQASQIGIERGLFKTKVVGGYNALKVTPKGLEYIRKHKSDILEEQLKLS